MTTVVRLTEADLASIGQRIAAGQPLSEISPDYGLTETDLYTVLSDLHLPTSRNEAITKRAEEGECLTAIGHDYEMSRERVRQIVEKTTTKSNEEIRAARRRRRDQARAAAEADKHAQVRQTAEAHPHATVSDLSTMTGQPLSVVKAALEWTEWERRADAQHYPASSDEDVLAEIRRVAALPGGQPLTGTFYSQNHRGGVSHARLLQRFGTWTRACAAAGVTARGPNPGRTYVRNWSEREMTGWVWTYLTSTDRPSYARFEAFLRTQHGAPSAQTVRNTLGSWVEMKRRAVAERAA